MSDASGPYSIMVPCVPYGGQDVVLASNQARVLYCNHERSNAREIMDGLNSAHAAGAALERERAAGLVAACKVAGYKLQCRCTPDGPKCVKCLCAESLAAYAKGTP